MRVSIVIRGGRGRDPLEPKENDPPSRGQDIGVYAEIDGIRHLLPVRSLVLRVVDRKAIATVELEVSTVELSSIQVVGEVPQ